MDNFVGTWKLVSNEIRREDGQVVHPWGKDAIGYLLISEEGYTAASVMRTKRENFASDDILGGTTEEKVSAIDSYVTYCGRYEVQGNKMVNHVKMSLFPNWVGGKQERFFEFEDGRLILSTPPMLIQGEKTRVSLIWERAK